MAIPVPELTRTKLHLEMNVTCVIGVRFIKGEMTYKVQEIISFF